MSDKTRNLEKREGAMLLNLAKDDDETGDAGETTAKIKY